MQAQASTCHPLALSLMSAGWPWETAHRCAAKHNASICRWHVDTLGSLLSTCVLIRSLFNIVAEGCHIVHSLRYAAVRCCASRASCQWTQTTRMRSSCRCTASPSRHSGEGIVCSPPMVIVRLDVDTMFMSLIQPVCLSLSSGCANVANCYSKLAEPVSLTSGMTRTLHAGMVSKAHSHMHYLLLWRLVASICRC